MAEQEQTLRERIKNKLITILTRDDNGVPFDIKINYDTDKILALILAEVDKAGLTEEQISQAKADYANGSMDAGYKPEHFRQKNWGESAIAAAQLEAIKKQLRGEGK
jgi:hypothetical protein